MYEVPNMTLIPQQMTMSCWYASARMLIKWRSDMQMASSSDLVPPELDAQCRNVRASNLGLMKARILALARLLGLRAVPPMTPTLLNVQAWLRGFGPLWVNGKSHVVVLAGVNGSMVKVYDPWPPRIGKVEWRSWEDWYVDGNAPQVTHVIQRGESLSAVGRQHGVTWQQIYFYPLNAGFRSKRPNPNLVHPGDRVFIPQPDASRDGRPGTQAVFLHCPMMP